MMGTKRAQHAVLALRDGDEIETVVRDALDSAPEEERAGLLKALSLIRAAAPASEAELKARWAKRQLADAGYKGSLDSVQAIKALRKAEPALSLLQAVDIAKAAAAQD